MKVYHRIELLTSKSESMLAFALVMMSLLFSSCSPTKVLNLKQQELWRYSDLRIIDPVDASVPALDIISLYVNDESEYLGLRLDLLDVNLTDQPEIFLGIDFKPDSSEYYSSIQRVITSGKQWDLVLKIPTSGDIEGYDSLGNLITGIKVRVFRDTFLDMIALHISKQDILPASSPLSLEVLLIDPSSKTVQDRVGPVNSRALPPDPAHVSFIFWNSFAPYTPAQALRMWDGAHTGPLSSRHGLYHLLNIAGDTGIPIRLYNFDFPVFVSALDYLGVYSGFVELVGGGIVSMGGGCGGLFCCVGVDGVIDYTKYADLQFAMDFIPLQMRKDLVNSALNGNRLTIGGDFSTSIFGNQAAVRNIFSYLNNHPWIIIQDSLDFTRQETIDTNQCSMYLDILASIDPAAHNSFIKQYQSTPNNRLKDLAWQTYISILSPANPVASSIASNYFWQLGHILAAANWFDEPFIISSCANDIDWDGKTECVLSSKNMFLTFELDGGYLAFSFYSDEQGIHQITAPLSEVMVGLGDPMTYNLTYGAYADPSIIPGALVNIEEIINNYSFRFGSDYLELFNDKTRIRKIFKLKNNGVLMTWVAEQAIGYSIPFGLDPWVRFEPDWSERYQKNQVSDNWIWDIEHDISILIGSSAPFKFNTFIDSKDFINQAEDPNFDYPQGHYLPFPFSVMEIFPVETAIVEINFLEP